MRVLVKVVEYSMALAQLKFKYGAYLKLLNDLNETFTSGVISKSEFEKTKQELSQKFEVDKKKFLDETIKSFDGLSLVGNESQAEEDVSALLSFGYETVAAATGFREFPKLKVAIGKKAIAMIGYMSRVIFIAAFISFFSTNFQNAYYIQKFLSVVKEAGNCNPVPKVWTYAGMLADLNGNWMPSSDFTSSKAIYTLNLLAFEMPKEQYSSFIGNISESLQAVGKLSSTQDLAVNLIYWNSWAHTIPTSTPGATSSSTLHQIMLTGDATYIMFKDIIQGTIASVDGDCPFELNSVGYNRATGDYSMAFSYSQLMNDTVCHAIVNPVLLGYSAIVTGDAFTLTIGTRDFLLRFQLH